MIPEQVITVFLTSASHEIIMGVSDRKSQYRDAAGCSTSDNNH